MRGKIFTEFRQLVRTPLTNFQDTFNYALIVSTPVIIASFQDTFNYALIVNTPVIIANCRGIYLYPGEGITAGVVGKETTVNIVLALSEVERRSSRVPSNLPHQVWRQEKEILKKQKKCLTNSQNKKERKSLIEMKEIKNF